MKIALIGSGKTGGEILNLHPNTDIQVYNSKNKPSVESLQNHDVAICFIPGEVFIDLYPILVESKIPVVSGSTGFHWNDEMKEELRQKNLTWISGSNFSLGMRIVHQMIKNLNQATELFENYNYKIHEVHHTKKLDAPSGTALSWNDWIDQKGTITHERKGDVVGDHLITFRSSFEQIDLRHQALDRKIFAQGALWAAHYLVNNNQKINPGVHLFEDITEKILQKKES